MYIVGSDDCDCDKIVGFLDVGMGHKKNEAEDNNKHGF